LEDIVIACTTIEDYLARDDLDDGVLFDAIRMRLIEIGEAVKALSPTTLALDPTAGWSDAAKTRDIVAHRYFDTVHGAVFESARNGVPHLRRSVERIISEHF